MTPVYSTKGTVVGRLKTEFYPHVKVIPLVFRQHARVGTGETVRPCGDYQFVKITQGEGKSEEPVQLSRWRKGIGERLKIEYERTGRVTPVKKIPAPFYLSSNQFKTVIIDPAATTYHDPRILNHILLVHRP